MGSSPHAAARIRLLVVKPGLHARTQRWRTYSGFAGIAEASNVNTGCTSMRTTVAVAVTLGCSHETLVAIRQPPESLCVALAETETNQPVIDFFFDLSTALVRRQSVSRPVTCRRRSYEQRELWDLTAAQHPQGMRAVHTVPTKVLMDRSCRGWGTISSFGRISRR